MAPSNFFNPSDFHPRPSPYHPPPAQPSRSPDDHTTVIIVVFVALGCVLFLTFLAFTLFCCFFKKKCEETVDETKTVRVDEHLRVKEAIVDSPHGPQTVVLSVEDDIRVDEEIRTDEKLEKGVQAKGSEPDQDGPSAHMGNELHSSSA